MSDDHLMDTFYNSFNYATKPIVDTVTGASFMAHTYTDATTIIDRVTKPTGCGALKTLMSLEILIQWIYLLSSAKGKRRETRIWSIGKH